ncbi:MAG TPA: dual specificity protein phosphatase family protein [Candidatus Dormibacteraeota bacterium]|nr:dual specificity protein phosphatase family protein [Candidatus Dormibacteraeota bacterium]
MKPLPQFVRAKRIAAAFLLFAAVVPPPVAEGLAFPARPNTRSRPAGSQSKFARKIFIEGLPNLGEVTPTLYRGAQPNKEGFEQLAKMHVDIIVDLRGNRQSERDIVTKLGMQYVPIPWFCMHPKDQLIARFLTLLRDNPDKKVFVHCKSGIDRTGMMVAAYRMAEDKWTAQVAMREMKAFGFTPFHEMICSGLSSYEEQFPRKFDSDPAFESMEPGQPNEKR